MLLFFSDIYAQNLLTNPDLDFAGTDCTTDNAADNLAPDGWNKIYTPDRSTETQRAWYIVKSPRAASPSGGCYFGFRMYGNTREGISQNITVVGGVEYSFSFDYLIETRPGLASCVPQLDIRLNGAVMTTVPTLNTENVWERPTVTFVAPSSGTFSFEFTSGGTCQNTWNFVDDLVLERVLPDVMIADASIVEGGNITFPVTLSNPSTTDITLTFTLTNGTAGNSDYTTTDIQITIPAGDTTANVVVPTTADTIDELNETFTIGVGSVDSGTVGDTTDTATGTIIDDDAPDITIADASITEGGNITFPVTLSNASSTDLIVTFTFTNGTAGSSDYTTTDIQITIPAGDTAASVVVPTTVDTIDELDETFTIGVGSVDSGTAGDTTDTATGTILDDDAAPDITIADASITEGGNITFPVTLSNASSTDLIVTFTLTNGTAGSSDYTTTDIQITIPAGSTTANVVVPTTVDTIDELDETFTIGVGSVDSGIVGDTTDTATGTILDDDAAPDITIADASITEGGNITFPVTLSNASTTDITLTFTLTNGTAENSDYTTTDIQITIPAGDTTANVVVPTTVDTIDELDETFTIGVGSVDSGTAGDTTDTATGTILDDDAAPDITIADANITEGGNITFPVTLSNASSTDLIVTFTLTNGTAENSDYTTTDIQITIPAGSTTANVVVPTTVDTIDELDETFTIGVGSVDSGTAGDTTDTATGTILDDDAAPDITIADANITEGGNITFPVTLSNASSTDLIVTFTFTNGTAGSSDYTTTDIQITIPAGDTAASVVVPTTVDTIDELDETFTVGVGSVDSGTAGDTTDTATGTILDDDTTPMISLIKTGEKSGSSVGDIITYTFTVTNTGNETLTDIVIDDILTGSVNLPVTPGVLAPNEIGVATATYTITQADIDLGEVINSATVIAKDTKGGIVLDISDSGDETIDVDRDNDPTNDPTITVLDYVFNLALTKKGSYIDTNNDGVPNVGDEIHYTFTVENTGNVAIVNINIKDPLPGVEVTGGPIDLAGGDIDTDSFTAIYVLKEKDLLLGSVSNQAIAIGQDPDGNEVTDLSDDPLNNINVDLDDDGDYEDVTVLILDLKDDVVVYTGMSPNGDGINDVFRIVGLQSFPKNTLQIYNRWGVKVFEQDGYEQSGSKFFEGISNGRATMNREKQLPVGTYYYMLEYENASGITKSKAGYLYINK
ncbi:DUF7507 domain-containing protein [Aquimarina muelleri]|uniref:Calx-beta domain-containing protein n=2 Tax=Aquimarina muelleri TaxID=279356 RepID=A0A918N1D8_9FLAO|nr:Calx-beta domain-containing protein [Aquimarina muelleri]MCX2761884.1 gliding motility-associated C-terminal domain-containing protein [Aquimarina muelleri]GGX10088.1 hypothetical protein GCM10007384_09750 [Aquimarina muelleri]